MRLHSAGMPLSYHMIHQAKQLREEGDLPPLYVTYSTKYKVWTSRDEYRVDIVWGPDKADRHKLVIPAGFAFDLASIPRIAWWLIAPYELSLVAPMIHDYLYQNYGNMDPRVEHSHGASKHRLSRKETDDIFLALMHRSEGVSEWRRHGAYRAVRMFGGRPWKKNRP